jgi:hypothetical protein
METVFKNHLICNFVDRASNKVLFLEREPGNWFIGSAELICIEDY